jgi:hypothetical protein
MKAGDAALAHRSIGRIFRRDSLGISRNPSLRDAADTTMQAPAPPAPPAFRGKLWSGFHAALDIEQLFALHNEMGKATQGQRRPLRQPVGMIG